jgi:hypothetical protein
MLARKEVGNLHSSDAPISVAESTQTTQADSSFLSLRHYCQSHSTVRRLNRIMLQAIGFWRGPDDRSLVHPKCLVDANWQSENRGNIVQYLRSASPSCAYLGYSWCRFECGIADHELGDSDLTDDVWCWPSGLAHYVEQHQIKLPDEFVAHAESADWQPPHVDEPDVNYDLTFWRSWCLANAQS